MKLTPTMITGITNAVRDSKLPMCRIAMFSGITYRTFRNWMKKGEELQQQIEDGKINKSDLDTNDKRRLELFLKVEEASLIREEGYMETLVKYADSKKDIGTYKWLLKLQNEAYRDVEGEESDTGGKSNDVVVVNISACGAESSALLSEFMDGAAKNGEEKESRKGSEGGHKR